MPKDDDILQDALEKFETAQEAESENRETALEDLKFARMGDQWPEFIKEQRKKELRPCLTINKLPAFVRQVVNDARQNKPSIKVLPVDSGADPKTADIINGLIRNIEQASNADVAYDTATECAVTMGFGYFKIDVDFAHDDTFDQEIRINRIGNPLSVYGDPASTAADSSDWNCAFETELLPIKGFERQYKGAEKSNWEGGYDGLKPPWREGEEILLANYWYREEVEKKLLLLSDGRAVLEEVFTQPHENGFSLADIAAAAGITVVQERMTRTHEVKVCKLSGAEVLEKVDWAGKYIPIIPVYGDEINVEGKRHFQSLIRHARGAQEMFNYWRTAATELVALAPKVPWVGPQGAFDVDKNWESANTQSHPFLEYDKTKGDAPTRIPLDSGPAAGALQEALNASDDMKAILGIYDASLGARSNETSGRAIMARQREGDVSTFHFQDNMVRAIGHAGRILIDLIPHVYSGARIVRVLGEDGSAEAVPVNQGFMMNEAGQPVPAPPETPEDQYAGVYELGAGKYDLTVQAGPSFSTRREEAAYQMTEMIRAFPDAAMLIGDILAKNLDWPQADEIAERLKAWQQSQGGADPKEIERMTEELTQLKAAHEELKAEKETEWAKIRAEAVDEGEKRNIDWFKAETDRLKAEGDLEKARADRASAENGGEKKSGVSLNVPDTMTEAIAESIGKAFSNIPEITLRQQPMRRVPVRDRSGKIIYADEVPIPEDETIQ